MPSGIRTHDAQIRGEPSDPLRNEAGRFTKLSLDIGY